ALALEAREILHKDLSLEKLWIRSTGEVSISTEPADAEVFIRPYPGGGNAWRKIGKTPLQKLRLPRQPFVWRILKSGFDPLVLITEPRGEVPPGYSAEGVVIKATLRPDRDLPRGMVFVPGGGTTSLTYPLANGVSGAVGEFFIDEHETTNEEY